MTAATNISVQVRARYEHDAGPWTRSYTLEVMAEPVALPQVEVEQATATDTIIPLTDTAVPPTSTPIPPTDTPVPPTATSIPPTNTATPTLGSREIASVILQGDPSGAFIVTWQPPREAPVDYRVNWARKGEDFPTWTDLSANAYPLVNTYTVTGLEIDVCYKFRLRARYGGSAGDWTEVQGKISGAC